jgi:hypothetical protein
MGSSHEEVCSLPRPLFLGFGGLGGCSPGTQIRRAKARAWERQLMVWVEPLPQQGRGYPELPLCASGPKAMSCCLRGISGRSQRTEGCLSRAPAGSFLVLSGLLLQAGKPPWRAEACLFKVLAGSCAQLGSDHSPGSGKKEVCLGGIWESSLAIESWKHRPFSKPNLISFFFPFLL